MQYWAFVEPMEALTQQTYSSREHTMANNSRNRPQRPLCLKRRPERNETRDASELQIFFFFFQFRYI